MHKIIKIEDIPEETYQGYYWYSDAEMPEVIDDEQIDNAIFTKLPFIIEGNLYCRAKRLSISIKNIDGAYKVTQVTLPEPDGRQYFEETYIAHDIKRDGIPYGKFRMLEAWEPRADETLAGMEELEPAWSAFAGFIK